MNIGIVLSNPPGYSETFFTSKIKGLQFNGHSITLYSQSKSKSFNLCTVKVAYPLFKRKFVKQLAWIIWVFLKLLFHPKSVLKFIQLEKMDRVSFRIIIKKLYLNAHLLTQQLDWLHFGFATMALGKENVAKSIGAKLGVSFRGFDMAIYPIKHPHCYDLLWQQVDKVHTISDYLLALAIDNGLSRNIAVQKITPAIYGFSFRNENNKIDNVLSLITVARLHWVKGLGDTLKALAILKKKNIKFSYTIVGDGKLYEELTYIVHLLGLVESVKLVGKKSPQEIKGLLTQHEVYIQYSHSEGFCNAVLEAQAMGLLCIVSDAGGLPENVLHNKSGWVVHKRNPQKLAEKIIVVSKMTAAEKITIKEFAINRVQKEFNLDKQQKEFIKFYKIDKKDN